MHHITLNIKDVQLAKQVLWWLEHLKDDGLEIVSVEDLEDLKALHATRHEASAPFEGDLAHAKTRKSLRGSLKSYAHPERMAREHTAWADAVSDAP